MPASGDRNAVEAPRALAVSQIAVGDLVLVTCEVVTVMEQGCRVKVAGITEGFTAYFCARFGDLAPVPK